MSVPALLGLSNELFESIVELLDIKEISSLRLVCRDTARKSFQTALKTHLKKKHVVLDQRGLERFVAVTSGGGVGCFVEDLTLIGLAYDLALELPDIESDSRSFSIMAKPTVKQLEHIQAHHADGQELLELLQKQQDNAVMQAAAIDSALLRQAFNEIRKHRPRGLSRLTLETETITWPYNSSIYEQVFHWVRPFETYQVQQASAHTISLAVSCLGATRLPVRNLDIDLLLCDDIFKRSVEQAERCGTGLPLGELETMSFGVSNKSIAADDWPESRLTVGVEKILSFLDDLHRTSERLAVLNIFQADSLPIWFENGRVKGKEQEQFLGSQITKHLATITCLPQLRCFQLSGDALDWYTEAADLIRFLRNHCLSLREIGIQSMNMKRGGWNKVFQALAGHDFHLDRLCLAELREDEEKVAFAGPLMQHICPRQYHRQHRERNDESTCRAGPEARKLVEYTLAFPY